MNGGSPETRTTIPRDVIVAGLVAVLLLAGGLWWLARQRPHTLLPAKPVPKVPADIQIRFGKVQLRGVSGGKVVWEVEAENFDMFKSRQVLRVTGLKKVNILNNGKQELTLTADSLERDAVSGSISVNGNVCVTGTMLAVRSPYAVWNPISETLIFPSVSVQFGDCLLSCLGATSFDVKSGEMVSSHGVTLTVQGSSMRADRIRVNLADQSFSVGDTVIAEVPVADLNAWSVGHHVPRIPGIPESIKKRYRDFKQRMARP
jgi:hypothetical protein